MERSLPYLMADACLLMVVCLLPACRTAEHLDSRVATSVQDAARAIPGPVSNNLHDAVFVSAPTGSAPDEILALDLPAALRLVGRHSRELQARRERLYLAGLGAVAADRRFGPQYSGTIEYVRSGGTAGDAGRAGATLGSDWILPTGANLALRGAAGRTDPAADGGKADDYTAQLEVNQPLLAGRGYANSHEERIQAERDVLYDLRSFIRDRQALALRIVEGFHALLIQQAVVSNTRANLAQATFLKRRSDALFRVKSVSAVEVMRSEQQELAASNRLALAESELRVGIGRLLLELGLPIETRAVLAGNIPDPVALDTELQGCIRTALALRLDLATARDRVADAERRVARARNAVLPDLSLRGRAAVTDTADTGATGTDVERQEEYQAGLRLDLPLDRRAQVEDLRRAQIQRDAARRALAGMADQIKVDLADNFERLRTSAQTTRIEQQNVRIAGRRADLALLRFKSGEASNRDVVEAQNELLEARNAQIRAMAAYEQQRLRLLHGAGVLDIAADGTLMERPVTASPGALEGP